MDGSFTEAAIHRCSIKKVFRKTSQNSEGKITVTEPLFNPKKARAT